MAKPSVNPTIIVGPSFSSLLLITFIVLKLCGVIEWSWWWVMSPLWIPVALVIVLYSIYGILVGITARKNSGRFR